MSEQRTLYARKLEVKPIDDETHNLFAKENHRSGAASVPRSVALGLFDGSELVMAVQFCYPRTEAMKRKYSAELLRMTTKATIRVPGGASKLIKHYIKEYKPADFFTYQDTSGEATAVYEHAGMTLVSQARRKQYLVAPGKTLKTGSRKEILGMPYATRYGPDRILGTKLGEVFREDGTRKSNKDIFIEDLGWHIEETSGDRVYEWVDSNRTYYTYKITATDSDKYYYGVSHVKKANASLEDCLNDGYYGSGSRHDKNKYTNWKRRHRDHIVKNILKTFQRKADAFEAEAALIGSSWKTNHRSLNGAPGGRKSAPKINNRPKDVLIFCEKHKTKTWHVGNTCRKCAMESSRESIFCEIHQRKTIHYGGLCKACVSSKRFNQANCPIHGIVAHSGEKCIRCSNKSSFDVAFCAYHGESVHQGESCLSCVFDKKMNFKNCQTHGVTAFYGEACCKCSSAKRLKSRICSIHGAINFLDDKCPKCVNLALVTVRKCEKHGETKHQGSTCSKCSQEKILNSRECTIHGLVSHHGDSCDSCAAIKGTTLKVCSIHGETKHQGNNCSKCKNASLIGMKKCSIHGKTKHRGDSCYKCSAEKRKKP